MQKTNCASGRSRISSVASGRTACRPSRICRRYRRSNASSNKRRRSNRGIAVTSAKQVAISPSVSAETAAACSPADSASPARIHASRCSDRVCPAGTRARNDSHDTGSPARRPRRIHGTALVEEPDREHVFEPHDGGCPRSLPDGGRDARTSPSTPAAPARSRAGTPRAASSRTPSAASDSSIRLRAERGARASASMSSRSPGQCTGAGAPSANMLLTAATKPRSRCRHLTHRLTVIEEDGAQPHQFRVDHEIGIVGAECHQHVTVPTCVERLQPGRGTTRPKAAPPPRRPVVHRAAATSRVRAGRPDRRRRLRRGRHAASHARSRAA